MKVIHEYLKVAGITQVELAKRAKISPANLNHFMQGRREPRIKNLRKLSEATGISIEQLIKGF
jgi:transcriptional regulator with XRE-family HTH domain